MSRHSAKFYDCTPEIHKLNSETDLSMSYDINTIKLHVTDVIHKHISDLFHNMVLHRNNTVSL